MKLKEIPSGGDTVRPHKPIKVLSCLLILLLAVCLTGCDQATYSGDDTSKLRKESIIIENTDCDTDSNEDDDGSLSMTGGQKIEIPDEYDSIQSNAGQLASYSYWGHHLGSDSGRAAEIWQQQGEKFKHGLPIINGRYGVVVKPKLGNAGDYIDLVYKDGNVLHAWVVDNKADENADDAWHEYGHTPTPGLCDILEFYVEGGTSDGGDWGGLDWLNKYSTSPATESGMEYITGTVDYVVNYGSMFDGVQASSADSESTSSGSSSSSISYSASNAKITTHKQWNDGLADGHTDPTDNFPVDQYESSGGHNGSAGDASQVSLDTSHTSNNLLGHDSLTQIMYIVLHSTESAKQDDAKQEAIDVIDNWNTDTKNGDPDRSGVGAHFVVARDGTIFQVVDMDKTCWHAGAYGGNVPFDDIPEGSDGEKHINSYSIGIEICHQAGDGDYPEEQLTAVDNLIAYIREKAGGTVSNTDANASQCDKSGDDDDATSAVGSDADSIHFMQADERWASHKYANTTIRPAGCGLCALTCCIDILLGQQYTPDQVSDKLDEYFNGDASKYSAGTMSSGATASGGAEAFGLHAEEVNPSDTEKLKQALIDGKCIWLGAGGKVFITPEGGTKEHGGHCIMFYRYADGTYYCHDSAESQYTKYTEEQFKAIMSVDHGSGVWIISK